ncbi:PREDICTED: E3 ubiquitin-protein ligase PRT1-like isoform X2 [Ipomoea nil]|uniref:E3 ubiquitin-protein ligase PRT1-like isoform X2 n=1 Tax=Ipomoea nil TaxID=35883 RepID=UPI0009015D32|nr:PREDICTED: E3 ubiquitin-protein ligase PRT1-like isoform X2 [Ipomoea nil]
MIMENQGKGKENDGEIEMEEIPEDLQCCVCLELLYKPIVLGCGHIACFWCVHYSMNSWKGSHCPICRHQYHHFPSICRLMHFLLLELFPIAYKRREMQMAEEEKELGITSPQFEDFASEYCSKELSAKDGSSSHSPMASQRSDSALLGESSSLVHASSHDATKNSNDGDEVKAEIAKREFVTNFNCRICEQLLCCPVVLNCGHVYCEGCIVNQCDKLCRCPACQMEHPNGYPNVFLVLDHFLERQFPEYASRKNTYLNKSDLQCKSSSTGPVRTTTKAGQSPGVGHGAFVPKIHYGVGCDYCGMYPILGDRYRCKDCKEKIGFDLCGACYNSSSKLPGKFNQQHRPEHKFELIQAPQSWIQMYDPQRFVQFVYEDFSEHGSAPDDPEDSAPSPISLNDNGEEECSSQ